MCLRRGRPRQISRRMRTLLILIPLFILFAGSVGRAEDTGPFEVEIRDVRDWRPVFGTVQSKKRANARVRLAGTLTELGITEGDTVGAGQVIGTVTDEKIDLQIAAIDARLRALDAEAAQAETDLQRASELRERDAVPQARLDEAQTRREVVEQTRAATQAERAAIIARRDEGAVLAPESGRVLSVPVVGGMSVQIGETVAIIATEHFILRASLPERHARYLGTGDTVRVADRGALSGGGEARDGRIVKVYPELEAGQVVIDIEAPGLGDFFVGERIRLEVATGLRPAIVVPPDYVDQRHGVSFARIQEGGEVVVQPGVRTDDGVEILAGLKSGDKLVPYRATAK